MSKFSAILLIVLSIDFLLVAVVLGARELWSELKAVWQHALQDVRDRPPPASVAEALEDVRQAAGKLAVASSLNVVLFVTLWPLWDTQWRS